MKNQDYHEIPYKTYTCSLSYTGNSEYMWREYAKDPDGIAIHFSDVFDMFDGMTSTGITEVNRFDNGMRLSRGIVFYDDAYKRKSIGALLNGINLLYTEAIQRHKDYLPLILNAFVFAINNMRCFLKIDDKKYKKETEYRFSVSVPTEMEDEENINHLYYKKVNETENDYIDIKFKKNKIAELWVSPFCENKYASIQKEMISLLKANKYIGVEVIDSRKSRQGVCEDCTELFQGER